VDGGQHLVSKWRHRKQYCVPKVGYAAACIAEA